MANALVWYFGDAGHLEEARTVYEELQALAAQYPAEAVLREEQAKAASLLVGIFGSAGHLEEARTVYEELQALAAQYPAAAEAVLRKYHPEEAVLRAAQYITEKDMDRGRNAPDTFI